MEAALDAVKRNTKGKNEARRLRASGKIPATLYGAQKAGAQPAPESVAVDPKPLMRILHSASGLNTLINLKLSGAGDSRVLVKNVQFDPVSNQPLHADFYRVNMDRKITVTVPVILKGEARGVKQDGGVLDFIHREIEVETLPANIPDSIPIDISDLGIGDSIHVRDVATNAAWTPLSDPDMMIVHVVVIKEVVEEAPAAAAAAPG
ncbi:MAG TPA: 50S ribosomal protein L25, partial [Vicinamibacterales bacterium]|nr:50S ribosomal protein L25 [Vicinamibacterales bacterium]